MYYTEIEYVQTPTPSLSSEPMHKMAEDLREEFDYWKEARQDLESQVWPACDDAFHCVKELPEAEGMDWADNSDRGETDVRDGVISLAESITLALIPRDETAFQVVSTKALDQGRMNDGRDLLAAAARRIDFRGTYEKHVQQTLVRGTSALWFTWEKTKVLRTYSESETLAKLLELDPEMPIPDSKTLRSIRFKEPGLNRPNIKVIDMTNLVLDPNSDLTDDSDLPMAIVTFKTVEELKNAKDPYGEPLYDQEVLKDIEPMNLGEIRDLASLRFSALELTGLNPEAGKANHRVKLVPVIVFHRQVRSFEDMCWVDCYFYLALSRTDAKQRIIRIQQNPNPNGGRCIFIDTYKDWIAGTPYGTGIVEHSLQAYMQKNVMSALTLNAKLATVFPAVNVIGGLLQEDRRIKLGPGSVNIVARSQFGTNIIAPIPTPQGGVQIGMQDQQWQGQKILAQMGAYGSILQDPTKSVTQAKTATQINTETTSGSVTRDNLLERMTIRTLEPLLNTMFQAMQENFRAEDMVFEKMESAGPGLGQADAEAFKDPSQRIIVTGFHGMMNKSREIEELREALTTMTQGTLLEQMPQLMPVVIDTTLKLLGRLGIKNLEKYKQDPAEILLSTPVGQKALQDAFQAGVNQVLAQMQGDPNAQPSLVPQDEQGPGAPPAYVGGATGQEAPAGMLPAG
ncbi:MAG: hypothetical protein K2X77_18545 [Candidatus Obscuribacterales bacterium]|jgi:hypothetical protein|nr:hypothetical protein [Candidatus Obscuribacterales bacterium]